MFSIVKFLTSVCIALSFAPIAIAQPAPPNTIQRQGSDSVRSSAHVNSLIHGVPADGWCKWWTDTSWFRCDFFIQNQITLVIEGDVIAQGGGNWLFTITNWPEGGSAVIHRQGQKYSLVSTTGMAQGLQIVDADVVN